MTPVGSAFWATASLALAFSMAWRVFAPLRLSGARDDLFPVARHRAAAERRPLDDLRDIAQQDRGPLLLLQDDPLEVLDGLGAAAAANEILLVVSDEELPPDGLVPGRDPGEHLREGEPVLDEAGGIDLHLILALVTAEREHVVHARRGANEESDRPVLKSAEIHQGDLPVLGLEVVLEHLTEARRVRPHQRRAEPSRDPLLCLGEALEDPLAGEEDVGPVLEEDGHEREAEQGE